MTENELLKPYSWNVADSNEILDCRLINRRNVRFSIIADILQLVLGPDQNLVPIGVTKLYCDFQLDKYMRGLKMYDGLFRTVA